MHACMMDQRDREEESAYFEIGKQRSNVSLQDAFLSFRKRKRQLLLQQVEQRSTSGKCDRSTPSMAALRRKFLDRALSYIGVPYARRYHAPESPTYHSSLFLDCCGLVRQVLRDLKEEFGFAIGRWNQAYMFDVLPGSLSGPEEMQAGDLVFVTGTYTNPKAKGQKHDIVHVEIWLGEGEKTVGARWQRGRVQIHDSYMFTAKSYHITGYLFKSIDSWLRGICKSCCPEHPWTEPVTFNPGKYSIFSVDQLACDPQWMDEGQQVEGRKEEEEEEESDEVEASFLQLPLGPVSGASKPCGGEANKEAGPKAPGEQRGGERTRSRKADNPKRAHHSKVLKLPMHFRVPVPARTFITCGGNAAPIVQSILLSKGWQKLEDKQSTAFTLKWVEIKQQIDYMSFRENEQIVNHFPNINILTTKIGLLESLRDHQRMQLHLKQRCLRLDSFVPPTYRMDVLSEREEFIKCHCEGDLWICKPTGANQGKGIFLVRELQQLLEKLESDKRKCAATSQPTARIVQRYISNPLLLEGRKFDIRVYLLIIAAQPFVVLYHPGYIRLSCLPYDPSSPDMCVHLTNQYQQKKHPSYSDVKEDTVWDFETFQKYLTEKHGVADDWVATTLTSQLQKVMTQCYQSVKKKLLHKIGYFDLLGFDFMLDTELNVWLIEVNVNPAMHTNCDTLAAIIPPLLEETLELAVEVFDKCRKLKPTSLLPLASRKNFSLLFS